MAPRANWKGYLKIAEVTCPVALYTAASQSDRVAFHMLNRSSGHRLNRQFVDSETGRVVDREQQVKGYELNKGEYVVLEPEEISAALPVSDKTLSVEAFISCGEIDSLYFDRPYYLGPGNENAVESYNLIREGLRSAKVAAIARAVLFRRMRSVLIRAHGPGIIATTLNFDYEVRAAEEVFSDISKKKVKGEMLELAEHIISTKRGKFDPATFDDRYEGALAELVKAKAAGKPVPTAAPRKSAEVVDLMDALRKSAGRKGQAASPKISRAKAKTKSKDSLRKAG